MRQQPQILEPAPAIEEKSNIKQESMKSSAYLALTELNVCIYKQLREDQLGGKEDAIPCIGERGLAPLHFEGAGDALQ
jgi:hypothetical protein